MELTGKKLVCTNSTMIFYHGVVFKPVSVFFPVAELEKGIKNFVYFEELLLFSFQWVEAVWVSYPACGCMDGKLVYQSFNVCWNMVQVVGKENAIPKGIGVLLESRLRVVMGCVIPCLVRKG